MSAEKKHSETKLKYRVAVYDTCSVSGNACRTTGLVVGHDTVTGSLLFTPDKSTGKAEWWVHPKQCRRLKKRERRSWFLVRHPHTGQFRVEQTTWKNPVDEPSPEIVLVTEVRVFR